MRPEDIGIIMYWSAVIATLIALVGIAITTIGSQRNRKEEYRVIVVEKCYKCGFTRQREYRREEDYVGKITGTCPKCGSPLYVDAIYEEKISSKKKQRVSLKTPRK